MSTRSHVVMFSGGIGSWAAAKRVAERHGVTSLVLVFTDTKMEDEDLYRFLYEAAANVGGTLVELSDGRTPWEVYEAERFIGNSRIDPCAKILKRKLFTKWRNENCDPQNTTIHIGIDWTERHRFERVLKYTAGWNYEAPLCEPPYLNKGDLLRALDATGIARPRLYKLGFAHNNCGGFCCKAGKSHFALLLRALPERYRFHEEQEERLRGLGINGTILADVRDGEKRPLTLREFRERVENNTSGQLELTDDLAAGCGCSLPVEEDAE